MPERSKRPDVNQIAARIVEQSTREKDTAAVSLGRRGGPVRAAKLTAAERSAIASHAAKARWHNGRGDSVVGSTGERDTGA